MRWVFPGGDIAKSGRHGVHAGSSSCLNIAAVVTDINALFWTYTELAAGQKQCFGMWFALPDIVRADQDGAALFQPQCLDKGLCEA